MNALLQKTTNGIYCARGGFTIDSRRAVSRAIVTHAHMDHMRRGCGEYVCARSGVELVRQRLGRRVRVSGVDFGVQVRLGDVDVSFHPAGHCLGSAQVRVESAGDVWVVSGDYKREPDPSCEPFEPVQCSTFVTEATFAHPQYCWRKDGEPFDEMYEWWQENRAAGKVSVLFAYALGKTQRVLAELGRMTDRPVHVHLEAERLVECYRRSGIRMAKTIELPRKTRRQRYDGELIIAPPKYVQRSWYDRFGDVETAFASGWMQTVESARRRGFSRGFAISDHADWEDILQTIEETGARRVLVHHGDDSRLVEHLRGIGIEAGRFDEAFPASGSTTP